MNRSRPLETLLLVTGLLGSLHMATAPAADKKSDSPKAELKTPEFVAVKNIGTAEFEKLRNDKNTVVLDVRTAKEYAAGRVPGGVNIDWNGPDFEKKVTPMDKNKTYLVHCAGGVRSAKAAAAMSKLGFKNLFNLEGGMKGWEKAGNKAEK